jgi:peptidyl-tRNA hydrolase
MTALPLGMVRLRPGGGQAAHKGLLSIAADWVPPPFIIARLV